MGPRHNAAENAVERAHLESAYLASMGPRHNAAENIDDPNDLLDLRKLQWGRGTTPRKTDGAAAGWPIHRASMGPRHNAAENAERRRRVLRA